jgi:hypothetical protein
MVGGCLEFVLVFWLLCDYNKVTSVIFLDFVSDGVTARRFQSPAAMCISEL